MPPASPASASVSAAAPTVGRWASFLIVGLAAAVMAFVRPGTTPLEGHEAFVILAAETMAQPDRWLNPEIVPPPVPANTPLNHWLVPVFNGRPRLEKTPLAYWAVAAPIKLGLPRSEFAARLPAAVSGVLLGLVTLALGRRLFAPRAALLGALALVTSLGFYQWSRNARPEMMLCLFATAAMYCFYAAIVGQTFLSDTTPTGKNACPTIKHRALWLLAGWLSLGLANCAKEFAPLFLALPMIAFLAWRESSSTRRLAVYLGASVAGLAIYVADRAFFPNQSGLVVALAMAVGLGLPPAWYLLVTRGWRQFRPLLATALPGALLMALLFVPWLWHMSHLFPNASGVFEQQVVERTATGGLAFGSKEPAYYLTRILVLGAPWSLFAVAALAMPFIRRFRAERTQLVFLLLWVFGVLLLFSAATGKRQHYILPALPAVALLAGYFLEEVVFKPRRLLRWLMIAAFAALVAGFAWHSAFPKPDNTQSVYKSAGLEARDYARTGLRVESWGEPDAAVVFYDGADIPVARAGAPGVDILIAYPRHAAELADIGFAPIQSERLANAAHDEPVFFLRGPVRSEFP